MSTEAPAALGWKPTRRKLTFDICTRRTLYVLRDDEDVRWWSDGSALFRGVVPAYLRDEYIANCRPIDQDTKPPLRELALYANALKYYRDETAMGLPFERRDGLHGDGRDLRRIAPVDLFRVDNREIAVDARYVAEAIRVARYYGRCYRVDQYAFYLTHDRRSVIMRIPVSPEQSGARALVAFIQTRRHAREGDPQRCGGITV